MPAFDINDKDRADFAKLCAQFNEHAIPVFAREKITRGDVSFRKSLPLTLRIFGLVLCHRAAASALPENTADRVMDKLDQAIAERLSECMLMSRHPMRLRQHLPVNLLNEASVEIAKDCGLNHFARVLESGLISGI